MRLTTLAAGAALLSLAVPVFAAPGKDNPAAKLSLAKAEAPRAAQTDTGDPDAAAPKKGVDTQALLIGGAVAAAVVVGAVALGDNDDETPASM